MSAVGRLTVPTEGPGLYEVTNEVLGWVRSTGSESGLCTLFVQHTSASLLVQENADPSASRDLETWMERLVKEGDPLFTHTTEGPDDMPAHVRSALTATSLSIPVWDGRLALGTWQGIFLWEHRRDRRERSIALHLGQ
ncbi:MAG: secondary thiamine-phosphate synthase enzyme YjbQ [Myxococcota bacterium]|nr:secondary thiamine-phosphate synthase enzyme YjbQ [Myxococcota bacterium]